MSQRVFSFYHKETGVFAARTYGASVPELELNTPPDHVAIEGHYHHERHRFDHATGKVVEIEKDGHVWNDEGRRFAPGPKLTKILMAQHAYEARLLETMEEERELLRTLALNPLDAPAKTRLYQIDDELRALKSAINGTPMDSTSSQPAV